MSSQSTIPEMGFVNDFDETERTQLGEFGEFVDVSDGDNLIREGEEQNSLFLIIFGKFHVQTEATGRPVLLGQLKTGDTVGEINIFDAGQASASVVAKSIGQIWRIDRDRLEDYLEAHPTEAARLLVNIATQLRTRLRKTNEKVAMAREAMLGSF
ncbi:MAG: cyclic nucleotide-binding domain-containing protein [Verrucomicrobiota bacterium]